MKKFFLIITIIGLGIVGTSCNNDDNNVATAPNSLKYSNNKVSIDYYSEGSTKVPTISWGDGKTGTFALDKTYKGLSINKDNGVISWTKEFLGEDISINVTAKNSLGNSTFYIEFTSKFKNQFKGKYNTDLKSTTLDKDITITMEKSNIGKMSYTEDGKTKIVEIKLSSKDGKLSFNNKNLLSDFNNGKKLYFLDLTPKGKSNFEGVFKISKLEKEKIKTLLEGKINLENI